MAWQTALTPWILTGERNQVAYDWVPVENLEAYHLRYPLFQQREHRTTQITHEARALAPTVALPPSTLEEERDARLRLIKTISTTYSRNRANDAGAHTVTRTATTQTTTYLSRYKWDPEGNLNEGVSPPQ